MIAVNDGWELPDTNQYNQTSLRNEIGDGRECH